VIISDSGKKYVLVPQGLHLGICVSVIDLGTHIGEWKGKKREQRKLSIAFELPEHIIEDGDQAGMPRVISGWYTASLFDKAELRKLLEGWRGQAYTEAEIKKGVDLQKVLGKPGQVQVFHKETKNGTRSTIANVLPFPKNTPVPTAVRELEYFSFEEYNDAALQRLPDTFKAFVMESQEWKALQQGGTYDPSPTTTTKPGEDFDDDIPF
jgi:hypothetical protein